MVHDLLRDLALDADALIGRAKTEAVKESLRRQVDRARNLGLFGAPTFFVGDEMFWGNDRLEDALEWAQQGPGPPRHGASPRRPEAVQPLDGRATLEQGRLHRFFPPLQPSNEELQQSLARRAHAGRPFVHQFRAAHPSRRVPVEAVRVRRCRAAGQAGAGGS